jgi:hypothetical protein
MTRRSFLRGLGGTAIALPLLSAFGRDALAQGAPGSMSADGFPKRFIYFFHPNGTIQDDFWPTAGSTERDFQMSRILTPLEAHRNKLIIPEGINLDSGGGEFGPGEPHQRGMGTVLTGRPLQEGDFVGGDGSLAGWGDGISLDQHLANRIGSSTPFKSLHLGVRADTTAPTAEVRTRISYTGPAQPVPPQNDPLTVFRDLFSDFETEPAELQAIREQRKSILDAVGQQMEAVNKRVGARDRQRLESHLAMIRDLEVRLENERVTGEACYAPPEPDALEPDSEDTMPDISRLHIDLMVMALACDLTRVASLQFSNAKNHIRFPWLDSLGDGHQLSHAGPSNDAAHEEWVQRDQWFASQFAYLLTKLDSIQEGDGTMLDNTVVLWINELSQGNTHSHINMPFVMAGSAGGYFDTGRYIQYDNASHSDLLVSIQNAFGIEDETFGDERFVNGPLSGLT